MALPSAYLTSSKNLPAILDAMANAQAPSRFTQKYLESLGFAGNADRLIINVLKSLGLLSDTGAPLDAYHRFLDKTESKRVLAEGIRAAYADLFQINVHAEKMAQAETKNKMKTLSQGEFSDSVLTKMAMTFKKLSEQADFSVQKAQSAQAVAVESDAGVAIDDETRETSTDTNDDRGGMRFGGLVYNINIQLPESRDPAVYDALFKSLGQHLR